MSYFNKFGDIMVVVPPIMLTHKTCNQDTASVTETLVVSYSIAMVNLRTGNVLFAVDHPMTAAKWKNNYNGALIGGPLQYYLQAVQ
eukprot:4702435-Pyramimonas_sp.AAC.1